jgi:hypothetical protein
VKDPKQKKQVILLSVLLLLLLFALYYALTAGLGPNQPGPPTKKSSETTSIPALKDLVIPRNPRRTGGKKEVPVQAIDPTIHLERLTQFDPGTPLNARNMFSLDAPPAPQMTKGRSSSQPGRTGDGPNVASAENRPPAPPPVVINLKFFGFKLDLMQKRRQGFFSDGDEVYLAFEGELVANRYRVVHIGDSTAEIEEVSSRTRRQINLITQ